MYRLFGVLSICLLGEGVPRWWSYPTQTEGSDEKSQPEASTSEEHIPSYFQWLFNGTAKWNFTKELNSTKEGKTPFWANWVPRNLDGWFWTGLDMAVSALGWLVFGKSWTQVRTGVSLLMRVTVALSICMVIHYLFALCWPIVSMILGCILTLIWLARTLMKCCGRGAFYVHRMLGGVPELAGAVFIGPGTGETPETAELRKFKKSGDADKWILVRRNGMHAVFKVTDSSSIRAQGLFVTPDPDSVRGDEKLLQELKGHDQLHLCRHDTCTEEGQHFKQYANVPHFNAERFQMAISAREAQKAGTSVISWFGKRAGQAAKRVKDYASESELEETSCDAHRIFWEASQGREHLSAGPCIGNSCTETMLLQEDQPVGKTVCNLCPKHASTYYRNRFQLKCAMEGCCRMGVTRSNGLRLCEDHGEVGATQTGPRRSASRSRSRSRVREENPAESSMQVDEGGPALRRRVRHEEPEDEEMGSKGLLEATRREEEEVSDKRRTRKTPDGSPGRTPRSGVQRSLAKLGMLNSPDRREVQSTLEEFMEQLVEGKELGLDEEDVRMQMAARYGLQVADITRMLYEQATEEQRKGTKGLSKFLGKWRKQLAADSTPSRSVDGSWSMMSTPPSMRSVPSNTPASEASGPVQAEPDKTKKILGTQKAFATIPAPAIYGQEDRKAGTGGEGPREDMAELAKAIKHQTSELATLVKAQHETGGGPGGTVKSLGRTAEELVFLLRACGQYTVEVGENEYGANLANALITAQAGASTKLRNAGFRQKVTTRLAVGLAGPHWGTQEKHALSAADFVPCTDAELDQHAVDSRTGKPGNDQRPTMPHRFEDWQQRVRRQNDIWALVYGKEWRGVRDHALETLSNWHQQAPHKWPLQVLMDVWEELHWRFVEELKTELRKLKALSGRETMSLQDLKFYALMPDEDGVPPLQLPRTFDLQHPEGWFMTEVLPRINRRQERILWKMTWEGAGKGRNPGQQAGGAAETHAGGDDKLTIKSLLGPKLTPEESNRAKDRAPTNKEGKLLCWGFITHLGCNVSNCQRAHEHLKGTFEALDPAVRMQLLRRGGLKRMKPETKETATEKIKDTRSQMAKDKDAKVKDGIDRKKAGGDKPQEKPKEAADAGRAGGVTWKAPAEMVEIDYTKQEAEFAEMVEGPNTAQYEHVPREARSHPGRGGESAPFEAHDLVRTAQRLADGPVLGQLKDASDDLYAWAATRVANDSTVTLSKLLEEMAVYGLGDLAAEAAQILEEKTEEKAGSQRRCQIGSVHWEAGDEGPGRALATIDGHQWGLYDYKEEVHMSQELAGLLGMVQPEVEKRQCVTKVLAAGYLYTEEGKLPTPSKAEHLAQAYRLEQARLAYEAEQIMGHAEAQVTPIESELRMYTHDILNFWFGALREQTIGGFACQLPRRRGSRSDHGHPVEEWSTNCLGSDPSWTYDAAPAPRQWGWREVDCWFRRLHHSEPWVPLFLASEAWSDADCPRTCCVPSLQASQEGWFFGAGSLCPASILLGCSCCLSRWGPPAPLLGCSSYYGEWPHWACPTGVLRRAWCHFSWMANLGWGSVGGSRSLRHTTHQGRLPARPWPFCSTSPTALSAGDRRWCHQCRVDCMPMHILLWLGFTEWWHSHFSEPWGWAYAQRSSG